MMGNYYKRVSAYTKEQSESILNTLKTSKVTDLMKDTQNGIQELLTKTKNEASIWAAQEVLKEIDSTLLTKVSREKYNYKFLEWNRRDVISEDAALLVCEELVKWGWREVWYVIVRGGYDSPSRLSFVMLDDDNYDKFNWFYRHFYGCADPWIGCPYRLGARAEDTEPRRSFLNRFFQRLEHPGYEGQYGRISHIAQPASKYGVVYIDGSERITRFKMNYTNVKHRLKYGEVWFHIPSDRYYIIMSVTNDNLGKLNVTGKFRASLNSVLMTDNDFGAEVCFKEDSFSDSKQFIYIGHNGHVSQEEII